MSVYAVSGIFKTNMIKNVNNIFTFFIIVMCLVFAYFTAFTNLFDDRLDESMKRVFIGLMLGYAAFRSYRLVISHRKNNTKNPE